MVDSLDLLEGNRGRRRISLDCTPIGICVDGVDTDSDPEAQIVVPLSFMAKETLRDLDVVDAEGSALPVLGHDQNAVLAAAAVAFLVSTFRSAEVDPDLWSIIYGIAAGPANVAAKEAEMLIAIARLDEVSSALLRDIASNFILMTQMSSDSVGQRRVIKYAYHWETASAPGFFRRYWRLLVAGLGFTTFPLSVRLDSIDLAESYHFECKAPSGLISTRVELPADQASSPRVTTLHSAIGHANGRYTRGSAPSQVGSLGFALDRSGLLPRVLGSALAVGLLFVLFLLRPTSYESLTKSVDAANALLLFIPAVVIAINARSGENMMTSRLLAPLRYISALLSLSLFIAGAMLVLEVSRATSQRYWLIAALFAGAIVVLTAAGYVILSVKGRRSRLEHERAQGIETNASGA